MNGGVLSFVLLVAALVLAVLAGLLVPTNRVSLGWLAVAAFVGASLLMRLGQ